MQKQRELKQIRRFVIKGDAQRGEMRLNGLYRAVKACCFGTLNVKFHIVHGAPVQQGVGCRGLHRSIGSPRAKPRVAVARGIKGGLSDMIADGDLMTFYVNVGDGRAPIGELAEIAAVRLCRKDKVKRKVCHGFACAVTVVGTEIGNTCDTFLAFLQNIPCFINKAMA